MFAYSCSVKLHTSGFDQLLESIFRILLVVEAISLQKVVKMLEAGVVSWQEVRWIWQMRQNLGAQFFQLLKCWLCDWAFSWRRLGPFLLTTAGYRHCSFQCISSICWAYFSDVMVSPGFRRLSGSDRQQTTKQWPWSIFGASLALESALEALLSPVTELVIASCHIKFTFHHTSQSDWEMVSCYVEWEKTTLQNDRFWGSLDQLMRNPLIKLFHLSNLHQMPNDRRMINVEFFSNFSCSCKRISSDD